MPDKKRDEEVETTAATKKDSGKKGKYTVNPGHTVTIATTDADGNPGQKVVAAGEEVELTADAAEKMPWAVSEKSGRARDGQTNRLRRRIAELEAENKRLSEDAKSIEKNKDSKEYKEAIESLKARGDNFIGRGEPEVGKVPVEVLDAFDSRPVDDSKLSDEVGMKGLERGKSEGPTGGTLEGSSPSSPSTPKGGESTRPGTSESSSGKK